MTASQLMAFFPWTLPAIAAVALLGVAAVRRNPTVSFFVTLASLLGAAVGAVCMQGPDCRINDLLALDGRTLYFGELILVASLATVMLSREYLQRKAQEVEEFYSLLLSATFGAMIMAASTHFVPLVAGLEILSVSLYALTAYPADEKRYVEAALKYLILASASTAFLLFGAALMYHATGQMSYDGVMRNLLNEVPIDQRMMAYAGLVLILVGLGFKLAVAPFHLWAPDVYQGAPAPVTALIATVSKGAAFAVLVRLLPPAVLGILPKMSAIVGGFAILSMFWGNLLALRQGNVKRLFAYSSIAHLGYLLVAFLSGAAYGPVAGGLYLAAYLAASLGTFGVISALSGRDGEAESLEAYRGLLWTRPGLAVILGISVFSLAGLPLTLGFIGKFYILTASASSLQWTLAFTLVFTSILGLFYYLRIIAALGDTRVDVSIPMSNCPWTTATLAATAVTTILLGVFPRPIIGWIASALTSTR